MTRLRSAALTDIGRVRRKNEDRFLHDPERMLFGVADGVGGLPGGAEAAKRTIEEITAGVSGVPANAAPDLEQIVLRANHRVHALGAEISPVMGIGSTLTFGLVRDRKLLLAHVGDSRCYAWRAGEIIQLTEDHSVENEARLRRARGEILYYTDSNRNALTRCMGQPGSPQVDLVERALQPGDRYLFCTDGVSRMIREAELGEQLAAKLEPEALLRQIVDLAIRRGGPDNATGVIIYIDEA